MIYGAKLDYRTLITKEERSPRASQSRSALIHSGRGLCQFRSQAPYIFRATLPPFLRRSGILADLVGVLPPVPSVAPLRIFRARNLAHPVKNLRQRGARFRENKGQTPLTRFQCSCFQHLKNPNPLQYEKNRPLEPVFCHLLSGNIKPLRIT